MKTGKKILVVYYSLSGNTERVAEDLAARLGADREKIGDKIEAQYEDSIAAFVGTLRRESSSAIDAGASCHVPA